MTDAHGNVYLSAARSMVRACNGDVERAIAKCTAEMNEGVEAWRPYYRAVRVYLVNMREEKKPRGR